LIIARKDDYDPFDIYSDLERDRLEEVRKRDAANARRPQGDGKYEEAVQVQEESEVSVLRINQQGQARVRKVAQVKRGQWVLGKDGKYHKKRRVHRVKKKDCNLAGADAQTPIGQEKG
jgi:hypothetical protein